MGNNSLVKGSIGAIARDSGKSIAESFISADVVVLVDTSGSMEQRDSTGGNSRYDQACMELANLQSSMPGKIAVLSFSSSTIFCPNGQPLNQGGGTNLADALKFAKIADLEGMQFIVISDGQPDSEADAFAEARKYKNKISTIYVGPERDQNARAFLAELARLSGGQAATANRAQDLAATTQRLLAGA